MEALPNRVLYNIACYAPVLCLLKKAWHDLFRRNFCKFHPDQFRPFHQPCNICGFVRRLKPSEQHRLWEAASRRRPKRVCQLQNSFIPSLFLSGAV